MYVCVCIKAWLHVFAQGAMVVKSRAVVKYSAAPPPCTYAVLQEQTDLKLPPANWLRESQLGPAGTSVLGSSSRTKPFSRYRHTHTHTHTHKPSLPVEI